MNKVDKTSFIKLQSNLDEGRYSFLQKVLLICGIVSSVLYICGDVIAAVQYEGYSYFNQAFSELGAIGSPVRSFMIPLAITYGVFSLAFGIGVCFSWRQKRITLLTGSMLTIYGAVEFLAPLFPMHVRGTVGADSDILHIVLTALTVLLILLSMGLGAFTCGSGFRWYSIGSCLAVVLFGIVSSIYSVNFTVNEPTPGLGILERINIYAFMIWVIVFAMILLKSKKVSGTVNIRNA